MRTTVEISDKHRARLLELAARRGEKGFSKIIAEALEIYLTSVEDLDRKRRQALKLRGTLSAKAANRLREAAAGIRRSWR